MNRQVEIKAEQIARMVVKGIKSSRIAVEMGMSYDGLMRILRTPEYLEIEERVRANVIGAMDARLAKRAELNDEVEDTIPEAMKLLLESVTKKRDLRAALELLDRDPKRQFAKGSVNKPVDPLTQGPALDSTALAAAVRDADVTHDILKKVNSGVTPAEA